MIQAVKVKMIPHKAKKINKKPSITEHLVAPSKVLIRVITINDKSYAPYKINLPI